MKKTAIVTTLLFSALVYTLGQMQNSTSDNILGQAQDFASNNTSTQNPDSDAVQNPNSDAVQNLDSVSDKINDFDEEEFLDLDWESEGFTLTEVTEKSQQIRTVTKEEIEKSNAITITEVLQKTAGLNVKNYGGYGNTSSVYIRGMSGDAVAILVDGVQMNSAQSGEFDLSHLAVADVEKIEIVKGGSDTKYNISGACGGVINIITQKKHTPGWNVFASISNLSYYPGQYYYKQNKNKTQTAAMDLFDTQEISTGFSLGNKIVYTNVNAVFHRAANHFLFKDDNLKVRRRINNEVYDAGANASVHFSLPYDIQLQISDKFYYADKNIPGTMTSPTPGNQKDLSNIVWAIVKMDKVGTQRIQTEFLSNYKFEQIDYEEPGTDSLHQLHTINVINRWDFNVTTWLNLSTDGDFTFNYLDSTDCGHIIKLDGGASITAEFSIGNHVQLIPSTKIVYYKEYPIVIPKVGALFFLPAGFTIKSNVYRTFKQPSINQLYWKESKIAKGNPDLRYEDGWGGDIILEYEKAGILKADSSFYVNYYMDKIQWSTNSAGQWTAQNIGKALYFGSDNSLITDLPTFIQFGIDYHFVLTYLLSNGLTLQDNIRIMYTPLHSLSAHVDFSWKSGSVSLIGKYTSERYTSNLNTYTLDPYFTLDISFAQNIGKYITVFAAVKNMLNAYYFETVDYPMPGGSVTVGVKVHAGGDFKSKKNKDKKENK